MAQCEYLTGRGTRCRATARDGSTWCNLHDPSNRAAIEAGRRKGGHNRRRPTTSAEALEVEFSDLDGVRAVLEAAATDALALDPSAQRCRVLVAAAEAAGRLLQTADYEARLAELEALIASQIPGARIRR